MLVPEIVNKIKFGVVNGKIVPTGTVGVEQLVGYELNDFTEEDLRSLIEAGHEDYFDDSEKDKLRELGILGMNDYSWSEIQSLIQAGEFSKYFKVGDTKDITLNLPAGSSDLESGKYFSSAVSGTYKVVVIGVNHNSELEGTNRVHFCIGQDSTGKEIGFSSMKMNTSNTNSGGWEGCPMRTWLNETLINGLPSDLVSVITPCTKYTDNTGLGSNREASVTATSDKLWLLSEFEVFSTTTNANKSERNKQARYAYYKNGASKIVRFRHQDTSICSNWWLRSAYNGNSAYFCNVNTGTISKSYLNINLDVLPCFTIS